MRLPPIVATVALLFVTASVVPCAAQQAIAARVDEYVNSEMQKERIPGLSLAVIKDGQIIQPKPQAFKLQCPHCEYDGKEPSEHGGTFRLLSDTTIWREIVRVRPPKKGQPRTLIVEGLSDKYDEDPEKNDRLECRACLKEFDLPKTLPVDYI